MGGALTIAAVSSDPNVDAAVPFYGVPDLNTFTLAGVKAPVFA